MENQIKESAVSISSAPPEKSLTSQATEFFLSDPTIEVIIMLVITLLVAAILGKLLANMAIGAASRNLNSEHERVSERIGKTESRITSATRLISERENFLRVVKERHGIS